MNLGQIWECRAIEGTIRRVPWRGFDWEAREAWLNAHPQYVADVDGASLHFVHLRSAMPDAPASSEA